MDITFDDFDFTVYECEIAHKFDYPMGYRHTAYKQGRSVSGLVYCLSGSAKYTIEGNQVIALTEGRMLYLPCGLAYTVENEGEIPFSHITVNFNITPHTDNFDLSDTFRSNVGEYILKDSFGAKEMLEDLVYLWANKKHGYRVMAKSVIHKLLYKYFTNIEKRYRSLDYEKIKPAKELLDNSFREEIPVSKLADLCGFSETHFRRLFKNVIGLSATDYRLNKRILLAKDLLYTAELSVSEVARAVGFEDANYFSRVFKNKVGVNPQNYLLNISFEIQSKKVSNT